MVQVLHPKPPKVPVKKKAKPGVLYRPPAGLLERIDAAADEMKISRNEAMTQLISFALGVHEKNAAKK